MTLETLQKFVSRFEIVSNRKDEKVEILEDSPHPVVYTSHLSGSAALDFKAAILDFWWLQKITLVYQVF